MSKYVIDLGKDVRIVQSISVTPYGNAYTHTEGIANLEELNSDYINEHYGSLQDEAYQRGLEDGRNETWQAARKIVFSIDGVGLIQRFFKIHTAQHAIAILKAHEEKQKADEVVKRGDVVRNKVNGLTYIVTLASEGGYVLLDSDGNFATSCITNSFEKTSKHVDIDKILDEMKG